MDHKCAKSLPRVFLGLSAAFIVILGIILLVVEKGTLHLAMNAYHDRCLDFVFQYYTKVGEWIPYLFVAGLLFYKVGWSGLLLGNIVVSGLISQGIKYALNTERPITWFAYHMPDVQLTLVEGVRMSQYYSCPSGHTVTFFALFLTLSWVVCADQIRRHQLWQVLFFCLTILGCYSRIYLSQHFAVDIWAGTLVGIGASLLWYPLVVWLQKKAFWDWNLCLLWAKIKKNH